MATRTRSASTTSTAVLEPQAATTTTRGKGKVAPAPAPVEADLNEDDFEDEDDDLLAEGDDLLDDEELEEEEELDDIEPGDAPAPAPAAKVDPATLTPEQRAENVAARITSTVHTKTGFSLQTEPTKAIEKGFVFGIAGLVVSSALAQGLPKDKAAEVRAAVLELMGNPGSNQKPATAKDKQLLQRTMSNMAVWIAFARLYYPLSADDSVALHQILELNARDLNRVGTMSRNNSNNSAPGSDDLY